MLLNEKAYKLWIKKANKQVIQSKKKRPKKKQVSIGKASLNPSEKELINISNQSSCTGLN
jgi:hypothetical protein